MANNPIYSFDTDFGGNPDGLTDNAHAFWQAGQTAVADTGLVTINFSAGTYKVNSNTNSSGRTTQFWAFGIKRLSLIGAGRTSTVIDTSARVGALGPIQFGGGGIPNTGSVPRIQSATAGASSVTLINSSDASRYTVGNYVMVSGFDIQGVYGVPFGYPANQQLFEYVKILSIVGGVVTFTAPLLFSYLSTWPVENTGNIFQCDNGGSATLWPLAASWDIEVSTQSMTITQANGQTYAAGRSITWTDCLFTGAGGAIPTQNGSWTADNCDGSGCNMEVDKCNSRMTLTNSTWNHVKFQSSSTTNFVMDNCTILTDLSGSGNTTTITNSTINTFGPGAYAYGSTNGSLTVSNCSITTLAQGGALWTGNNTIDTSYTMANGVISVPNGTSVSGAADNGSGKVRLTVASTAGFTTGMYMYVQNVGGITEINNIESQLTVVDGTHLDFLTVPWGGHTYTAGGQVLSGNGTPAPPAWGVPGLPCFFTTPAFQTTSSFRVLGVTQDTDFTYIQTNLSGGFPPAPSGGAVNIRTIPCTAMYMTSCTGNSDVVDYSQPGAQGLPIYAYSKRTYTGGPNGNGYIPLGVTSGNKVTMWGTLVAIRINVITPYTNSGTLAFHLSRFDNWTVINGSSTATLGPVINTKIAGERLILPTNTITNPTAQSGDSGLTVPGPFWFGGVSSSGPDFTRDVSGESSSFWPVISVEIITDQGFTLGTARGLNRWLNR